MNRFKLEHEHEIENELRLLPSALRIFPRAQRTGARARNRNTVEPKSGSGIISRGVAEARRIREDIGFGELEALTDQVGAGGQAFQQSKSPVLRASARAKTIAVFRIPFLGRFAQDERREALRSISPWRQITKNG